MMHLWLLANSSLLCYFMLTQILKDKGRCNIKEIQGDYLFDHVPYREWNLAIGTYNILLDIQFLRLCCSFPAATPP